MAMETDQTGSRFLLLILGGTGEFHHVAAAYGWRVAHDDAGEVPDLVAVGANETSADAVAAIRDAATPIAAAPIVLVGGAAAEPLPAGVDDRLPATADAEEASALLARWRPDTPATLARIEAALGTAAVRDLLERLRRQLEPTLASGDDDARCRAHRLAGIAGLLGFAALGEAWLDVEEGRPEAATAARRETRRALAAIARRLG
jgi:HPt (histidine-containing phosphotransfer) domain-containing protein